MITVRQLMLFMLLLVLAGCCSDKQSPCPNGECPFDPCASMCPRPRDMAPSVEQINQSRLPAWDSKRFDALGVSQKSGLQVIDIGENAIIILSVDRFFEFNCATIREDAYAKLDEIVCLLSHSGCTPLFISGHTDNVASTRWNCCLANARAQAICAYFWSRGIHFRRMTATGCGDCAPIANYVTVAGCAANRRIEIRIRKTRGSD